MNSLPILIVEDERALALAISATVQKCGGTPRAVGSLAQARAYLAENAVQGIVLDIGLPDGNGLALLETMPESKRPPVILVTAHGQIENAIAARKLGVRDFFDKPINFEGFAAALRALLDQPLRSGQAVAQEKAAITPTYIGAAPSMRSVFQKIAHACASREPVLIIGQTGTGKSATARLIAKHCELDTGQAIHTFRAAQGSRELQAILKQIETGILCIDPIDELDDECQTILAAELDGAAKFRLVATAGPGLFDQVTKHQFRSDLFYRLQVLEIRLPSLKDRREDIPVLVSYFLGQLDPSRIIGISEECLSLLMNHDWPGNLRELQNVTTYACTLGRGAITLGREHLPDLLSKKPSPDSRKNATSKLAAAIDEWLGYPEQLPSYREISGDLERILIDRLLTRFDGKIAPMASALEANRTTIRKKLSKKM